MQPQLLRHSVAALKDLPADQHAGAVHAYVKALQWCMAPLGCVSAGLTSVASLIIRNVSVRKAENSPVPKQSQESATATTMGDARVSEKLVEEGTVRTGAVMDERKDS